MQLRNIWGTMTGKGAGPHILKVRDDDMPGGAGRGMDSARRPFSYLPPPQCIGLFSLNVVHLMRELRFFLAIWRPSRGV